MWIPLGISKAICMWKPLDISKARCVWIPFGISKATCMWMGISNATCMWIPLGVFQSNIPADTFGHFQSNMHVDAALHRPIYKPCISAVREMCVSIESESDMGLHCCNNSEVLVLIS